MTTDIPQKPEVSPSWGALFKYYERNRSLIIQDYKSIGFNKTLDRWDVTSHRLCVLLRRWRILTIQKTPLTIPRIE